MTLLTTYGLTLLRQQMGTKKSDFYKDYDLSVGSIINIFNRKFVLYDCDEFTREYYRVKYGISKCHHVVFGQSTTPVANVFKTVALIAS